MTNLLYGRRCPKYRNGTAEVYNEGIKLFNEVMDPGAHPPVDLLPFLKYVPSRWASWKLLCDYAKGLRDELYSSLLSECERALDSGNATGCYLETVLKNKEKLDITRDEIMYAIYPASRFSLSCSTATRGLGAVLMDAGAETSASFLQSFSLALLSNPDCQRRAREEVDSIVGTDRLPMLDDWEHLPYVQALAKEVCPVYSILARSLNVAVQVHRFRPILPVGIPHVCSEDVTVRTWHAVDRTITDP
jgi:hypothetical protein